jgi:hypothetical protein
MSNLLHKDESDMASHGKYGMLHDGKLALPDGVKTQTIYVSAFEQHGTRIPAFALDSNGPFYPDGFKWNYKDEPLSVTFVFSPEIASVKTDHRELVRSPCSGGRQNLVIPPSKAVYNFDVEFSSGCLHDPQIDVNPVGGGG